MRYGDTLAGRRPRFEQQNEQGQNARPSAVPGTVDHLDGTR